MTTTSESDDEDETEFTWVVSDTNRWNWIDDQYSMENGIPFPFVAEATDLIGNSLTFGVDGLPSGLEYEPDPGVGHFTGMADEETAGDYTVTLSVTGGGATDTRIFNWTIYPENFSGAVLKLNSTLFHFDDIGFVNQQMPSSFLAFGSGAAIKIKVMTDNGDGTYSTSTRARVTRQLGDIVGFEEVYWPGQTSPGNGGDFYVIPKIPSEANDDIVLVAFRFVNNAWVQIGQKGMNGVRLTIGTHLKTIQNAGIDIDVPNHEWDGIVDANTTKTMRVDSKFRIPPRKWSATDLWVTKKGVIGAGKFLWLDAPLNGAPEVVLDEGQSDDNGRVALSKVGPGDGARYLRLLDGDFTWPTNPGETTAKYWIRGHVDAKTASAYQTKPGHNNKLYLRIFASPDASATFEKHLYWTQRFSVAAIPTKVHALNPTVAEFLDLLPNDPQNEKRLWGARYPLRIISDSGEVTDLDKVQISESVPKAAIPGTGLYAGETGEKSIVWNPANIPDSLLDDNGRFQGSVPRWRLGRADFVADLQRKFNQRGNGSLTVLQNFVFLDSRSAGSDTVRESGFQIKQENEKTVGGKYLIKVTRTAVANNGAEAGIVEDDSEQKAEVK